MNTEQQLDDPSQDLLAILDKHGVAQVLTAEQLKGLMVDLSVYLVNRDYAVIKHGQEIAAEPRL